MSASSERPAAKRQELNYYDVVVLPRVVSAENEVEARALFVQALHDDVDLIRVSPHADGPHVKGNDAIGI